MLWAKKKQSNRARRQTLKGLLAAVIWCEPLQSSAIEKTFLISSKHFDTKYYQTLRTVTFTTVKTNHRSFVLFFEVKNKSKLLTRENDQQ